MTTETQDDRQSSPTNMMLNTLISFLKSASLYLIYICFTISSTATPKSTYTCLNVIVWSTNDTNQVSFIVKQAHFFEKNIWEIKVCFKC